MANYLCQIRGTLQAGTVGEDFQHSLSISSTSEPSAIASALAGAWEAEWSGGSTLNAKFPAGVVYTEVTVAQILGMTDGKLMAALHQPFTVALPGTGNAPALPTQNACAVTLIGGSRANGAPMKGRFYLPPLDASCLDAASGLISPVYTAALATHMASIFAVLRLSNVFPQVWSRVEGRMTPVGVIRVGNRMDTIRRRRNSAAEVYAESQ